MQNEAASFMEPHFNIKKSPPSGILWIIMTVRSFSDSTCRTIFLLSTGWIRAARLSDKTHQDAVLCLFFPNGLWRPLSYLSIAHKVLVLLHCTDLYYNSDSCWFQSWSMLGRLVKENTLLSFIYVLFCFPFILSLLLRPLQLSQLN